MLKLGKWRVFCVLLALVFFVASSLPEFESTWGVSAKETQKQGTDNTQGVPNPFSKADKYIQTCDLDKALAELKLIKGKDNIAVANQKIKTVKEVKILLNAIDRDLSSQGKQSEGIKNLKRVYKVCNKSKHIIIKLLESLANTNKYNDFISTASAIHDKNILFDETIVNLIINTYSKVGHLKTALALLNVKKKYDPENRAVAERYHLLNNVLEGIANLRQCYNTLGAKSTNAAKNECIKALNQFESSGLLNHLSKQGMHSSKALYHSFACLIYKNSSKLEGAKRECIKALDVISANRAAATEAVELLPEIYIAAGRTLMALNEHDDALSILSTAKEEFPGNSEISNLTSKCWSYIRNKPEEDLYSILGVSRDATTEQINTAYKALARKNHPDTKPEGKEREKAMEKMSKINKAKEVLSSPQKREEYDNGQQQTFFDEGSGFGSGQFYNTGGAQRIIIHESSGPYQRREQQYFIRFTPNDSFSSPFGNIFDSFFIRGNI